MNDKNNENIGTVRINAEISSFRKLLTLYIAMYHRFNTISCSFFSFWWIWEK
jgi:hypothetical protein